MNYQHSVRVRELEFCEEEENITGGKAEVRAKGALSDSDIHTDTVINSHCTHTYAQLLLAFTSRHVDQGRLRNVKPISSSKTLTRSFCHISCPLNGTLYL